MVNNFNIIKPMLEFNDVNDFYFIQILKRRKENPEMKKDVSLVENFFVYSDEELANLEPKIVEICNNRNARAYIRLNRRNAKKVGMQTLRIVTDYIISEDYKSIKTAYLSACGQYASEPKKKWAIDIDNPEMKKPIMDFLIQHVMFYGFIPSKSCGHLIVPPFNPNIFTTQFSGIDLNKDATTNLYIP